MHAASFFARLHRPTAPRRFGGAALAALALGACRAASEPVEPPARPSALPSPHATAPASTPAAHEPAPTNAHAKESAGATSAAPTRCAGCVLDAPPGADPSAPRPLLIALHGDGGDAEQMVRAWAAVTRRHGALLLALRCPEALGCPRASFWRWFQSPGHDPAWIGREVAAVRAQYQVDPQRIYATGYSGGASYLGGYAPAHAEELAAVAYVAGGFPYARDCATRKLPVHVLIGAADGMRRPYVEPLVRYFEGCGGHPIQQRVLEGVGHRGMLTQLPQGEAERLWTWFAAQRLPEPVRETPPR